MNNQTILIGLDSCSRSMFFNPLDPFCYLSVFELTALLKLRNYSICFLWFSSPDHVRVTDET